MSIYQSPIVVGDTTNPGLNTGRRDNKSALFGMAYGFDTLSKVRGLKMDLIIMDDFSKLEERLMPKAVKGKLKSKKTNEAWRNKKGFNGYHSSKK